MTISPETRDHLSASIAQLVRTGRYVSGPASAQLYGELPSFGWALLLPLERNGDQRCSALAAWTGVDVSVASRQLAVLERAGHVRRRPDPQDGRASLLSLTPAGAQALAATRALRSEWAFGALAGWDEDDARRLAELLDRLVSDLETAGMHRQPVVRVTRSPHFSSRSISTGSASTGSASTASAGTASASTASASTSGAP